MSSLERTSTSTHDLINDTQDSQAYLETIKTELGVRIYNILWRTRGCPFTGITQVWKELNQAMFYDGDTDRVWS